MHKGGNDRDQARRLGAGRNDLGEHGRAGLRVAARGDGS